jgi:hypothetical protein
LKVKRSAGTLDGMEPFPDLGTLDDAELKALIERKRAQEEELSYERRLLHGEIDLLRAELRARLDGRHGEGTGHLSEIDVDKLSEILAHRGPPLELPDELAELG